MMSLCEEMCFVYTNFLFFKSKKLLSINRYVNLSLWGCPCVVVRCDCMCVGVQVVTLCTVCAKDYAFSHICVCVPKKHPFTHWSSIFAKIVHTTCSSTLYVDKDVY